jgi:hypothetical protein
MKLIAQTTLSTSAASVTISDIPGTYDDLYCVMSTRAQNSGTTDDVVTIYFNNSTSGYTARRLYGLGSGSPGSDTLSNNNGGTAGSRIPVGGTSGNNATANTFGNGYIYIPNYAGSTNKSVSGDGVGEHNATGATASIHAGLWSNTAAITSITFTLYYSFVAGFASGSSFFLYGIKR